MGLVVGPVGGVLVMFLLVDHFDSRTSEDLSLADVFDALRELALLQINSDPVVVDPVQVSKLDVLFDHACTGRNGQHATGVPHIVAGWTHRFASLGVAFWAGTAAVLAQSVSDYAVRVSATVETNPPSVTLAWPADPRSTGYTVSRKARDGPVWGSPLTLATNATGYVDSSVPAGGAFEYRIRKTATTYTNEGYIYAGINVPQVESRGKVVLVVDDTHAAALATELARLQQDLVGDGWTVLRHDVSRTESVANVKSIIRSDYVADAANVKAVFLLGHVPVPYSGDLNPDGHPDHKGAWPADVFYGEMNGSWTDATVNDVVASDPRNDNVPGDGKYDQSTLPSDVELQVGRVDLANLPAFSEGELELLRRYLNKDHRFRHGQITAERRGLIDDHFGTFNGEAFALSGWRNFAPFFGASNIFAGDWMTALAAESHLWAYGCGGGSYTGAGGVGSTAQFATNDARAVFTMLFGSYFGDWDSRDNFLRAPLGTPTYTLTCAWAGRPHWPVHHMALGETIGFSARLAQNNSATYLGNVAQRWVHIALMGDPTLRMHPVEPPRGLVAAPRAGGGVDLHWNPPGTTVAGYAVYRAATAAGPFTRLNGTLLSSTNYSDPAGTTNVYMVRAVTLEMTPSGSYYNSSQGVFQDLAESLGAPRIALVQPANETILLAPAKLTLDTTTFDAANRIERVEFWADDLKLAEDTGAGFGFTWSNAPAGSYLLSARGFCSDGLITTSGVAFVRVDAPLVAAGAVWKYLDDGSDQGTAWRAPDFDDSAWASGPAELGYSNSPVTVVNFGPDPANKYLTTWFRRAFTVPDPTLLTNLTLGVLRDDGAVVYLNGTEAFRSNMPNGPIDYQTLASGEVSGDNEARYYVTSVDPALLLAGANVLAVEVHQVPTNSTDLGFNLYLNGSAIPVVPTLAGEYRTDGVLLAWPASPFGYRLESASALPATNWSNATETVRTTNGVNSVMLEATANARFFRLVRP
jgi:hypothetical protein